MAIRLSDHFNYKKLLRFVLPSILMMVFTSVYGVVDGIFVSTVVGNTAFKAVNLVLPLPMALGSLGFMLGAGGSAIVSKTFGEGKDELANKYFSLLVYVTAIGGVAVAIVGEILLEPFCRFFKADGEYLDYCLRYGRIVIAGVPLFMLQNIFQTFFVTAERPKLGFLVTLIAGCSNIVGDWLLVGVFRFEVEGAAVATVLGEALGAIIPIVYFFKKNNDSILRLGKTEMHGKVLLDACTNGSSEFLSNVSGSFVSMLYNYQLTRLVGSDGVGAYGVLMYVNFIFFAIFIGYAVGIAPVVGYNYGAKNDSELKNIFKKSMILMGIFGIAMTVFAETFAPVLADVFSAGNQHMYELTCRAFLFSGFVFLMCGFNIFGSAFFTALGNGPISALISCLRTLVFQTGCVLLLPLFLDIDGIWLAVVVSDFCTLIVTWGFLFAKRKKYSYM